MDGKADAVGDRSLECLNVGSPPRRGRGRLREPKWWSTSAAGVPHSRNEKLVVERRVVDVVMTTRQEGLSRASEG